MTGMYGVMFWSISQPSSGPLPYALSAERLAGSMPNLVPAPDTRVRVTAKSRPSPARRGTPRDYLLE
ncbi:hypothetical protein [Sphingomonas carotinifaciens]|nr:hypothetical protein [Sphingomonas carotinifaciens]MWC44706.1 hypothetical protein [Sphingomonas carotinifaciens]